MVVTSIATVVASIHIYLQGATKTNTDSSRGVLIENNIGSFCYILRYSLFIKGHF